MAQIFPSDIAAAKAGGESLDELKTLVMLRDGLPEDYRVYHSVHWSKANPQYTAFGEIDFVVVNKAGDVLVIEQKNGSLNESPQGLEKQYGLDKKIVYSQVQRNLGELRSKFRKSNPQSPNLTVDYLIYCPDYRVIDVNAAAVDMLRTVDAQSKSALPDRVVALLNTDCDENAALRQELHNFMLGSFRIAPDVNAYKVNQGKVYCQLLDGLSEVIESLQFTPFRLRVVGTAGSGKTQVTMRFCERMLAEGRRPLLLCFNRPLSDKFTALAPKGVMVDTYHGFCRHVADAVGLAVDFKKIDEPGFWQKVQEELVAADLSSAPKYNCLVIDEGQDFKPEWYEIIQLFLEDESTQLWLEDPLQNLRGSDPVPLPEFVTYKQMANFRTPTSIAGFIKATLHSEFEQRNQLPGLGVALYEYSTAVELQKTLNSRIIELLKVGFDPDDIAIVSCHGMRSTALVDVHQLGKHKVRRFTGKYDAKNNQIYTEGSLTFDTIFRFKGQQAPAVVLVDLDEKLQQGAWETGVLYCAMTRATVRLELIAHKQCPWVDVFRNNL